LSFLSWFFSCSTVLGMTFFNVDLCLRRSLPMSIFASTPRTFLCFPCLYKL
jgi:hypothetical protein